MPGKEIERGKGLITQLLKTTPTRKLDQPYYRLNPELLTTPSDREYAAKIERLSGRKDLKRAEQKELRHAIKKLMDRGKLARVTEEEW